MDKKNDISRRDFLKIAGAGAVVSAAVLAGCKPSRGGASSPAGSGGALGETRAVDMAYRTNPHTGDKVSLLGYGCMRWPVRKNAEGQDEVDQEKVNELVDYALAHGVNYFDTAPVYVRGWSEGATGKALSRHPRDSYFVATKASRNVTLEQGKEMYRNSMRELQVDYIDYYLLHSVGGSIESFHQRFVDNGFLDFLLAERAAGRIRNLGWSFHGNKETFDYVLAYRDIQWDFCQIQLNYQDWTIPIGASVDAKYLYDELVRKNVPVVIMEPLLGGRLARIPAQAQALMRAVRPDDTPAAWAFRFAGTPPGVLTVLSGMVYMEHLQDNLHSYAPFEPLVEEEYAVLDEVKAILADANYIQCTTCEYCMPCPYGIDIPQVFAHYNKCVSEGRLLESSSDPEYRKARRAFLVGYDRSVPRLRQAQYCIQCEQCRPKCPQNLNIPVEMARVDASAETLRRGAEF
jgi:predicted aldo/keto reductase-like oxidoreductase